MKKNILLSIIVSAMLVGCAATAPNEPQKPIEILQYKESKDMSNISRTEKGILYLKNGKKVMDNNGNIVAFYENGTTLYYLVKTERGIIVKNEKSEVVKIFEGDIKHYFYDNNKMYLCESIDGYSFCNNLYLIDEKGIQLHDKNLSFGKIETDHKFIRGTVTSGKFAFIAKNSDGYIIRDILAPEKEIVIKTATQKDYNVNPKSFPNAGISILGARGKNIFYVYESKNGGYLLEAFDTETQQAKTITNNENIIILKSNDSIALKIFRDNKQEQIIYLNELVEAKNVDNFKEVLFKFSQNEKDTKFLIRQILNKSFNIGIGKNDNLHYFNSLVF